ncbi:regulatory protein [Salmonella enterica subsp. enterica serovar Virchow str. ATCC 51955]|nr:regulatory protein [Salmonella enterica subsp. enterica serovar Virchow str. ATCC 51955]
MATPEGFARNPGLVQTFYNARRQQLQQPEIQPNAAHLALAKLEEALGDIVHGVFQRIAFMRESWRNIQNVARLQLFINNGLERIDL